MAIEIIIKNKSAKNELPSIDVLTGGKFKYGSFDGVRLNMEQKGPDGSISMFNPERIGRGMSVGFGDNEISLFCHSLHLLKKLLISMLRLLVWLISGTKKLR